MAVTQGQQRCALGALVASNACKHSAKLDARLRGRMLDARSASPYSDTMGVWVQLAVACDAVDPAVWDRVYEESWRFVLNVPGGLLDAAWRTIAGHRQIVLTGPQRSAERWRVRGDAVTKLTALGEWAVLGGDITPKEHEAAHALLKKVLGERFPAAVLFDDARMRARLLKAMEPADADKAIAALRPRHVSSVVSDLLGALDRRPLYQAMADLERAAGCSDVAQLGEVALEAILTVARLLRDEMALQEVPDRTREEWIELIARHSASRWILTEEAWASLETETPEGLRLLTACAACVGKQVHLSQAVRALFENRAVRRWVCARL